MSLRVNLFVCLMVLTAGGASRISAQTELTKLTASDGAFFDQFGYAMAVSGKYLLVGNDLEVVYSFDLSTQEELFQLTASDAGGNDQFGSAVSVSGNYGVIGAPNRSEGDLGRSGGAYVFDLTTGEELRKLIRSDVAASDRFGRSVAAGGDYVVVGSPYDDAAGDRNGSAYVFTLSTGEELHKLTASDVGPGKSGDYLGTSVAITGDYALAGSPSNDHAGKADSGAVYVFDLTTGEEAFKLTPSDAAVADEFGSSVAASGHFVVVGSPNDDDNGDRSGSAYVFDLNTQEELFKLTASDGDSTDYFGRSVAVTGNFAVVGCDSDEDPAGLYSGSVYVFDLTTGEEAFKLTASDAFSYQFFGFAVAASESRAVVGGTGGGSVQGAAYVYSLPFVAGPEPVLPRIGKSEAGIEFRFDSVVGITYAIESSSDLDAWIDAVSGIEGDGTEKAFSFEVTPPRRFYRVKSATSP